MADTEGEWKVSDTTFPDGALRILADAQRRHVIRSLQETDRPVALTDLAEMVAARTGPTPTDEPSLEDIKRTYLDLYHRHVPKMEAHGVVMYDRERNTVALTEGAVNLIDFLERVEQSDDS